MKPENIETQDKKQFTFDLTAGQLAMVVAGFFLLTSVDGYCNGAAQLTDLDKASSAYTDLIFSPPIRKTIFGLGFAWGAINSFMKSSFIPFLTYTGLGAVYNFTPSIINMFSSL